MFNKAHYFFLADQHRTQEILQVFLQRKKDKHFSENNEVVVEDDWINRNFKATTMNVTGNASLYSGRNVANITSNITASNNAQVHIGYKTGDAVCVRSDYTGYVTCHNSNLSEKSTQ